MSSPRNANEQLARRRQKLEQLQASDTRRLSYSFDVDHSAADIATKYSALPVAGRSDEDVRSAGRLVLMRHHGGLSFGVLRDRTGTAQLFVDRSVLGDAVYKDFLEIDRGDWIGVTGRVMRTDKGEISIAVGEFETLGKALRPPPDKDKGLTDVEVRYRQRYVDLMTNEKTRRIFDIRRKAILAIRHHLEDAGFWEVEGPILQSIQGGATARPFITHHNALDIDMYLRIALELHLKRLVVGGMERVFELSRVFRNEGIDVRHNPEFTMLEAYQAFTDYSGMMDLVEGMVTAAVRDSLGGNFVVQVAGQDVDLAPPWPRISMADLIEQRLGVRVEATMPVEEARRVLDGIGVAWEESWGSGKLMKQVVDEKIQHDVVNPIFVLDYPEEVSPLARVHRSKPGYVERFELMVAGFELCNAYSEQNDAAGQLAAFEMEARAKAEGDPEAGDIDLDYVRALEYGMPCTAGLGIGIDRLVMLLSGADNIREVILFPTMRPEAGTSGPTRPHSGKSGLGRLEPAAAVPAVVPAPAGPIDPAPASVTTLAAVPAAVMQSAADRKAAKTNLRSLAGLAAFGGIMMLLPLVPFFHSRLRHLGDPIGPVWFRVTGHLVTMLVGLSLLFLAGQLARGKRRAWEVCTVLFALGAVTNFVKGPHPVSVVYCLGMVVALLISRKQFHGRSDPPSLLRLLWLAPAYVLMVIVVGFVSLTVERDRLGAPLTFTGGLDTISKQVVGIHGPYEYHRLFFSEFFPISMLLLGIVGVVGLAFLLFRPLRYRAPHTENDWTHARRLVRLYGSDTLAFFALRDDKSFFFSSDGEAFVAYTYLGGYALASGDPIGAPGSVDSVLDEFLIFCRDRSWRVAFLAARSDELPRYAARGLRGFYLGDEAIVHCDTFSLDGPSMKGVRAAVRRVAKSYRFEVLRESAASPALVTQLNAISQEWRGKAPERGFTMSLSQDIEGGGANPEFLLCVALDEKGRPGGFLRIVPAYGDDFGYTLDLMRHRPDAPNGMTEYLIAQSALALGQEGISRLSMNFAMWGKLYEEGVHYGLAQRLAKRAVDVFNPFFQIKSLHDFNAKFSPEWLSRMLVFEELTDLPRVGLLYAGAEGFLSLPGVGGLFVPKAVGGVSSEGPADSAAA
jgi:lysyl-tRNA synthetase class 2